MNRHGDEPGTLRAVQLGDLPWVHAVIDRKQRVNVNVAVSAAAKAIAKVTAKVTPKGRPMKLSMVTLDCRDAAALSGWWARLLGGTSNPDVPGFWIVRAPGVPVRLGFQEVPEPTPGKNKMHLDLDFGTIAEAVDHAHSNVHADFSAGESAETVLQRLADMGAARVDSFEEDGFRWWVLADPEGNQFCVSRADEKADMAGARAAADAPE